MTVHRMFLAAVIVGVSMHQAAAQFGGMPGLPGGPGMPGAGGFGPPQPQAMPPQCKELLTLRDTVQKHGKALSTASAKKASAQEACRLFKTFLSAELRMVRAIETNGKMCGVPPDVAPQIKANHAQAGKVAKQVCEAAAQGARPPGPSLSDALGTSPPMPDASKRGSGTFDTLTGNPLAR
jgi:hypothetical protein